MFEGFRNISCLSVAESQTQHKPLGLKKPILTEELCHIKFCFILIFTGFPPLNQPLLFHTLLITVANFLEPIICL